MARGNQRDKAREAAQKKLAGQVRPFTDFEDQPRPYSPAAALRTLWC